MVYNWGNCGYTAGHSGADHTADLIGNYFIAGPSSKPDFFGRATSTGHIYFSGNYADMNVNGILDGRPIDTSTLDGVTVMPSSTIANAPVLPVATASGAAADVIAHAGMSLCRDAVDRDPIDQVRSYGKTGAIVMAPPVLTDAAPSSARIRPETMPDGFSRAWKIRHGLDPNAAVAPIDGPKTGANAGYTWAEVFANEMAR